MLTLLELIFFVLIGITINVIIFSLIFYDRCLYGLLLLLFFLFVLINALFIYDIRSIENRNVTQSISNCGKEIGGLDGIFNIFT